MSAHTDVLVIGAGLSGLATALALEARGLTVQVIEAQQRVGGRIHSMRELGSNAEAGATYIGAGYTRLIRACTDHGVELMDVTPLLEFFREQDFALGTELIRQSEWGTHTANPFPEADRAQLPWAYHRLLTLRENPLAAPEDWLAPEHAHLDVSVQAWMRSLGLSQSAIDIGYNINPSFGASAEDVSALLLLFRGAFSKAQRRHTREGSIGLTVRGGVQRIPEAMTHALEREIQLGKAAAAISLDPKGAVVRCADGSRYEADRVVCSLPPPVLRGLAIDPPLEGLQAEAVRELPAQPLTQVYMAPKSRFWEQDGYAPSLFTDSVAGMIAAVRNGTDPTEITGLNAWAMGPNAAVLDRLPAPEAGQLVIDTLARLRPASAGQLEFIGLQSWGRDSGARGAWTYFRPGQVNRYARVLGQAHGRLHFCGEHLGIANRGMEAAMESADTTTQQILEASGA
jgi:monoamine oxidase